MRIIIQDYQVQAVDFLVVLSSINSRSLLPLCSSKLQSPFLPCVVVLEERKENRQKNPVVFGRRGFWSAPSYIYVLLWFIYESWCTTPQLLPCFSSNNFSFHRLNVFPFLFLITLLFWVNSELNRLQIHSHRPTQQAKLG